MNLDEVLGNLNKQLEQNKNVIKLSKQELKEQYDAYYQKCPKCKKDFFVRRTFQLPYCPKCYEQSQI